MGGGSWMPDAFKTTTTARSTVPDATVFKSAKMDPRLDPTKLVVRESRDSIDHPETTAIIVAFDVTGSMGEIPVAFARGLLGTLVHNLIEKEPVPGPQVLIAAVGDSTCDRYPLQVGEFESDNRIDDWLTKIHIEQGGGGTMHESYGLVYHFAGTKTSIDCAEKHGRKGFLFTIGDEAPHAVMAKREIEQVFGPEEATDVRLEDAIKAAQRLYDVIHICVSSRSYPASMFAAEWRKYLGQNVLLLEDHTKLPELIFSTIALRHGMSVADTTKGFSAETTAMVLKSGVTALATGKTAGGIATL